MPSRTSPTSLVKTRAPVPRSAGKPPVGSGRAGIVVETADPHVRPFRRLNDGLGAVLVLGDDVDSGGNQGLYRGCLLGRVAPIVGQNKGRFDFRRDRLGAQMEGVGVQYGGRNWERGDEPQLARFGGMTRRLAGGELQLPDVGEDRAVVLEYFQVAQMQEHDLGMLADHLFDWAGITEAGGEDDRGPVLDHLLRDCLHLGGLGDVLHPDDFDVGERLFQVVAALGHRLVEPQVPLGANEDEPDFQPFSVRKGTGGGGKFGGRAEAAAGTGLVEDLGESLGRTAAQLLYRRRRRENECWGLFRTVRGLRWVASTAPQGQKQRQRGNSNE